MANDNTDQSGAPIDGMAPATSPLSAMEKEFWNRFTNLHKPWECAGHACPVHKPLRHGMRSWPMHWRSDTGVLERICEHGIGHPDPGQFDYWEEIGMPYLRIHGCDGCCINAVLDAAINSATNRQRK